MIEQILKDYIGTLVLQLAQARAEVLELRAELDKHRDAAKAAEPNGA